MTASPPRALTPHTRNDVVADLERRILAGEFAVGSKLPSERELCTQYDVSRPVVREALAGLVERGYIDVHPGRGSFVRGVLADELSSSLSRVARRAGVTARDLVTARLMLECFAAEHAASNGTDEDLAQLQAALEAHERATALDDRVATDLAFHEAIAVASGNPVVALMFGAIRHQVYALMQRSQSDRSVRGAGDPLHRKIAEHIVDRDPASARAAMAEHLELALSLYGEDLDKPLSDVISERGLLAAPPLAR